MIGFSQVANDAILELLAGMVSTVGLFTDEVEIDDPGYERQPVEFDAPEDDNGGRSIGNVGDVLFKFGMDSDRSIDQWAGFDAAGELIVVVRLAMTRDFARGDRPFFNSGKLSIWVP